MSPLVHIVVNVDSDPDPVSVYQSDDLILRKYRRMREILQERTSGAAAWTVLTGPKYRTRFCEPPFVEFWREIKRDGADLVLHPEEDLYGPPEGKPVGPCTYFDAAHMREVILQTAERMRKTGLPFSAFRGGYHGFTDKIGAALKEAGIAIDLSCAPGIEWQDKAAAWAGAPLSAYYMSDHNPARSTAADTRGAIFEIPWAWDGKTAGSSRPRVVGENYIINEFSSLSAMTRVWDAVVARASAAKAPQIVSMICHTYTMGQTDYEERLQSILAYIADGGGHFVSPTTAKRLFDVLEPAPKPGAAPS